MVVRILQLAYIFTLIHMKDNMNDGNHDKRNYQHTDKINEAVTDKRIPQCRFIHKRNLHRVCRKTGYRLHGKSQCQTEHSRNQHLAGKAEFFLWKLIYCKSQQQIGDEKHNGFPLTDHQKLA